MAKVSQQFVNLYYISPEFREYNYDSRGTLVKCPIGNRFDVLSFTLSEQCANGFLRQYRGPATVRDYILSKLFQILVTTFCEEFDELHATLEQALAEAFPGDTYLRADTLDWETLFDDYQRFDLVELVRNLHSYLAVPEDAATTATPTATQPKTPSRSPGRQGRPPLDERLKDKALEAKLAGKSNRHCAAIIYKTHYPTPKQTKNANTILREYAKKKAKLPKNS